MSTAAGELLKAFETLPPDEQYSVATAILRRLPDLEYGPFTDEELSAIAEETLIEIDCEEAERGKRL